MDRENCTQIIVLVKPRIWGIGQEIISEHMEDKHKQQQGRPSWMTEVLETQDAVSSALQQIIFF